MDCYRQGFTDRVESDKRKQYDIAGNGLHSRLFKQEC
jgi:hypothetical protein